jgi:hypothetical protein
MKNRREMGFYEGFALFRKKINIFDPFLFKKIVQRRFWKK